MADRPLIGVTGPRTRLPLGWWATQRVLRALGACPVHLMPGSSLAGIPRYSAVIIGGGDDIDAALYDGENPERASLDPERDAFEVEVIEAALRLNQPLLGICRGAQLLNVVLGGSLFGDIRARRIRTSNRRSPWPSKIATLEPDAKLCRIMSGGRSEITQFRINSLHHQAIDRLGEGLRVVARDADELVQAVECPQHLFRKGVQWHPEYLPYLFAQRRIFAALVDATRIYSIQQHHT